MAIKLLNIIVKWQSGSHVRIIGDGQVLEYDINHELDMAACRAQFNLAVDQLASNLDRRTYLQLYLTERNGLRPGVWEDYLNIKLILLMAKKYAVLEVYTDSGAVFDFFIGRGALTSFGDRIAFFLKKNLLRCKQFLSSALFLIKLLRNFCIARVVRRSKGPALSDCMIITTWVSDTNFASGGFVDSYFPGLKEFLMERGETVMVCPFFYSVKNNFAAHRYMLREGGFLIIEDYLRFTDYFEVLRDFFRKIHVRIDSLVIGDIDMTSNWSWYRLQERPISGSLFSAFVQNLSLSGAKNIKIFINHENLIPEKMLLFSCKKYLPKARLIANFHTTMPLNLLNLNYAGAIDFEISPLPDLVLFNSPTYQKYFESRWPDLNCGSGYAMKQSYLSNMHVTSGSADKISVFLSGRRHESLMILDILNKNARILMDYQISFRFHPMDNFDLKSCCKLGCWYVYDDDIAGFLSQSAHVISAYSMCLIEAAIAGKNVGFIYDRTKPLLNPFDILGIENYTLIGNSVDLEGLLSRPLNDLNKVHCEEKFYLKRTSFENYLV